jgi:hypothetical protein
MSFLRESIGKALHLTVLLLLLPMISIAACTSTTMLPPTTGVWPQANYDYANTRDAAASLISPQNVNKLGVAWNFQVAGVSLYGALATSPIVVNGTVYLQDLQSNVYAIDLQSGNLKWEKLYNASSVGPNGVAAEGGKVFVESSMQTIAALVQADSPARHPGHRPATHRLPGHALLEYDPRHGQHGHHELLQRW